MTAKPIPPNPHRLLVRGVNWLGDAVMTTPALRRLRERFPSAHLALLTHEKLADLWREHPDVDEVIPFRSGASAWSVAMRLRRAIVAAGLLEGRRAMREALDGFAVNEEGEQAAAERVRSHGFDLALILPNSPRSALEAWLARIPCRVGHARPWRNWLLTHAIPERSDRVPMRKRRVAEIRGLLAGAPGAVLGPRPPASVRPHQLHDYLHLAAALGADPSPVPPFLYVTADEVAAVRDRLQIEDNGAPPLVGLNAGAEYGPAKRWPIEHFVAAVLEAQATLSCQWLILGGAGDTALANDLEVRLRSAPANVRPPVSAIRNVAGQTSLRELMSLLRLCRVVLTNDTGPMHLAAALGTPVVVPFGSTSPELTGPGLPGDPRHRILRQPVPCAPCFLRECPVDSRCLRDISPAAAAAAVLDCLASRAF